MAPADRASARGSRRIGRYLVTARLGKGGMGMVYRAFDEALEREVALKTLTLEGTLEAESRQRFQIEAKAAARLQHPNIVTVFELGEERGLPFIAMELLPGVDLDTLLRSGEPLLVEEALDVVAQVCRGLQFAHDHGIVHRDVKPSNIRLLDDGTAKILDFGIAKLGTASGVTRTGMMVGTIHYMSPEQVQGRPLDGRSDVFSAGVILYELVAGRRPFTGETPSEVLYKIAHTEPPPFDSPALQEVPELRALMTRALARDLLARPTAGEMADALGSFAGERLRALAVPIPADALETVNTLRRLVREGHVEEGVRRLREVAEAHPRSVEARRVLRVATGEMWRRRNSAVAPPEDDFPELAATFRSPPTQVAEETLGLRAPAEAHSGAEGTAFRLAGIARAGRHLLWIGGAILLAAVAAGAFLVARRPPPRAEASDVRPPAALVETVAAVAPAAAPVSRPAEPPAAPASAAPAAPPTLPPPAATGAVMVRAPYPVDVMVGGRVLGRAPPGGPFALPVGRHAVTLASPAHFLRLTETVEVREDGLVTLVAPELGRIHIKANPDNCEVFIDGAFVDYPPILDRAIAAGAHRVGFRWADGARADYPVEVRPGAPAYVTGRREGGR